MVTRLQGDEKLIASLVPDFPVGCRRSTPGNGYLEALKADNVRVVLEGIVRVTSNGILTSTGEHIDCDVIVCATGFDLSFRPRFPILGRDSISLQDKWTSNTPQAYMSLAVEDFPNYFGQYNVSYTLPASRAII